MHGCGLQQPSCKVEVVSRIASIMDALQRSIVKGIFEVVGRISSAMDF